MKKNILLIFLFSGLLFRAFAQFQVGSVTVTPSVLTSNLHVPWELVWGPDNFIWMTERSGRISRVNPVNGQVIPLLTIPDIQSTNESGLLGMVLHPDFNQHPYLYTVYTYNKPGGGLTEKLVRYTYNGTTLTSPTILLDNIAATSIHNGSRLLILPDLTLLMTTGDASNTSTSQNQSSLNGKILRLNLDGTVPADNPVPGSYVYTFGHRNPQGLLQAPNGLLYSSEHGPNNDDELNLIESNRNYGWPTVHGFCNLPAEQTFCTANNVKEPLTAWTPTIAVAGIAYYNHPAIPGWQNSILMNTLKGSHLRRLELDASGTAVVSQTVYLNGTYGRLRSICISPAGKVYLGTSNANNADKIIVLENLNFIPSGISKEKVNKTFTVISDQTNKQLRLKFSPEYRHEQVTIYNLQGQKLLERNIPHNLEMDLPVSNLAAGLYLIRAGEAVQKVMLR
jgi:aldose sugar dehydrogenase